MQPPRGGMLSVSGLACGGPRIGAARRGTCGDGNDNDRYHSLMTAEPVPAPAPLPAAGDDPVWRLVAAWLLGYASPATRRAAYTRLRAQLRRSATAGPRAAGGADGGASQRLQAATRNHSLPV